MWVDAPWRAARSLAHVPGCSCVPWVMFQGNVSGLKGKTTSHTLYIRYSMVYPRQDYEATSKLQMHGFNVRVHVPNPTVNLGTNYVYLKRKWSILSFSSINWSSFSRPSCMEHAFFPVTTGFPDQTMKRGPRSCLPSSWFQVHLFQSPVNPEALLLCRCFNNPDTAKTDRRLDINRT